MTLSVRKIGFIGLGRIGKPIAVNILKAGFELAVYDLRSEPVDELVTQGAQRADAPRALASADLIAVAVVDDAQVEDVLIGKRGVFAGGQPGSVVAIHSTVLPRTFRRGAEMGDKMGVRVIDAPVSGGEAGARGKSLCYMVGGDAALLERCRDVFATSASDIFHMGDLGCGAAAKMIVQAVTCINMLAAHEAELLAEKSGLNYVALQQMLHRSSAQSFVIDHWLDRFKLADDPTAIRKRRAEVFQKSLAPARELAEELGLSLSGTQLVERILPRIMGIDNL
jgi:3-hydroxyisobutyrate dehydrogenase-like beta-hydroxyacid dehydrogenase